MNALLRKLWRWQATSKLNSDKLELLYPALHIIGEQGNINDVSILVKFLDNREQVYRVAAIDSIKALFTRFSEDTDSTIMQNTILTYFSKSTGLISKLSAIEVIKKFDVQLREELLGPLVLQSGHDLQYQIVDSLSDTKNLEILDDVLIVSESLDLVLKRKALETWYKGLENHEFDEVRPYACGKLHYLIRATYELQLDGKFLKKVLSFASVNELPEPKAYPDFIIRYLNELLGTWEYDPDTYRSLHGVVVPSYFTFDSENDSDTPYVIL